MDYGNFTFHMDAEIVFGKNTEAETGRLVKKYGGTKAMIVYGSGSIRKSGLYDRVAGSLTGSGIPYVDFGGVQPNPKRSFAEEGTALAQSEGVDFLLGVGGGSAIDTAKAIAIGAANGGDFWRFFLGKPPESTLPVGTIVTIAASGSETSRSLVLVDDIDTGQKKGRWCDFRPRFTIMNPELTYSLPARQTAAGCVDIISHTFMRYFSNYPSFLGDRYGEATVKTVMKYAPIALKNPEGYEARAEIMLAGSLSHCDLMAIGRPMGGAGGEHPLESQLSGHYDTVHGAGLSVIMPALLKYFTLNGSEEQVERVARFAINALGISEDPAAVPEDIAERGIERFISWLGSVGMPTSLADLGVPESEIPEAVERCIKARGSKIDGFMTLDEAAVSEIYYLAK